MQLEIKVIINWIKLNFDKIDLLILVSTTTGLLKTCYIPAFIRALQYKQRKIKSAWRIKVHKTGMPQSPNKDNRYYRQLECLASTALFIRIGEKSWERKLFSFQFHINVFRLTWFITYFTFTWSPWPWVTTFAMYSIRCKNIYQNDSWFGVSI